MNADGNVIKIKHDVLFEVAKLAFAGELEEQRDHLPLKLIPGPTPQFRCCIYKEREIIRQRIRLAEGKAPGPEDDGNIIQVISSACEDCPISSYTVTENCQNCLGKACINACKFGAIEPGHYRSHIAMPVILAATNYKPVNIQEYVLIHRLCHQHHLIRIPYHWLNFII